MFQFQFRGLQCDYLSEGVSRGDSDDIANQAHLNWQYTYKFSGSMTHYDVNVDCTV